MDIDAFRAKIRARSPRSATGRWFDIRNADDGETTVIRIYDVIDSWGAPFGVSADELADELTRISTPKIEVQINSPGGEVWDGIAIFNALRAHPAHVTTRVDGMAASAASVIVQAGDHRVMMHAGQMMIHEAWGMCVGPADDMRQFADVLDQQSSVIADIYATRADGDRTVDDFRQLMRDETWLTDQGAVELGLADEVVKPERQDATNLASMTPEQLRAALGLDRLEDLVNKIPAPVAVQDPDPTGAGSDDSEAVSFLRAVLATPEGVNS